MSTERWQRVKQLFDQVLERPVEERATFIDSTAIDDPNLAAELRSLLQAYEAPGPLEHTSGLRDGLPHLIKDLSGSRIGPYRLEREVGRGGMGVVYLAARVEGGFSQRVAIKLAPQALVSESILARFTAEREILAKLEHPNIARLLDGGVTPEGWPYLVMDYVEGDSVTHYVADNNLALDRRLDLIRTVCEAVHHAHKNLVVHRDLKPSNILIDREGNVKLLDFGIAKLLASGDDPTVVLTQTGGRLLTPAYASPEQFRGRHVTTASDVYSLGIIAYELLAGAHPYALDGLTADQVRSAICETVPTTPSAARSALVSSGASAGGGPVSLDLDNIVMMALRKEPGRRYASAAQLAEDIRRFQDGLPVHARTPTVKYRVNRFVKRNKALVAAASMVMVALLGAVAATSWQARIATESARTAAAERDRAREAAAQAGRINDFLRGILETANPAWWVERDLKGPEVTVLEALDEASRRMESELADDPEIRADIHHTLGETYTELHMQDLAREHFEAALTLRQQAYEAPHPKIAESLFYLAVTDVRAGKPANATRLIRQAVAMQRVRDEGNNLPFMLELHAGMLRLRGDFKSALKVRQEALNSARVHLGPQSATALIFELFVVRERVTLGDLEGARDVIAASAGRVAWAAKVEGMLHARARDFPAAERVWPDPPDPSTTSWALGTAADRLLFAEEVLLPQGRTAQSFQIARDAIELIETVEPLGSYASEIARARGIIAMTHVLEGRASTAEAEARSAIELLASYGEPEQPYFWAERRLATRALARSLADQGRFSEAEPLLVGAYQDQVDRGLTGTSLTPALEDLVYLYDKWEKMRDGTEYRVALTEIERGVVAASP